MNPAASVSLLVIVFLAASYLVSHVDGFLPPRVQLHRRGHSSTIALTLSTDDNDINSEMYVPTKVIPVEFCGPGCVLLAQPNDSSHFFVRAAVFIYQYEKEEGARGVILERPSAFSMGETSPGIGCFEANTLFIGGEQGSDTAIMLGKLQLEGACKYVGSGIYLGGMKAAKERVTDGIGLPKDYKFFFNHAEWEAGVLEKEIAAGTWDVIKAPPEDVLCQDSSGVEFWSRARNQLVSEGLLKNDD